MRKNWKEIVGWSALILALFGSGYLPYYVSKVWWTHREFGEGTGVIGDTVGGIVGPVISAVSSIVVFVAFREQVKANRLIQDQFEYDSIYAELDALEEYTDELEGKLFERVTIEEEIDGKKVKRWIIKKRRVDSVTLSAWAYRVGLMADIHEQVAAMDNENLKRRVERFRTKRLEPLLIRMDHSRPYRKSAVVENNWDEAYEEYAKRVEMKNADILK